MALRRVALAGAVVFVASVLVGHTGARLPTRPVEVARPTTSVTSHVTRNTAPPPTTTTTAAPRPVVVARASRSEPNRTLPAARPRAGRRADPALPLRLRIRWCESGDNYTSDTNPHSTASGAYQFVDGTWRSWQAAYGDGRYFPRAFQAPPDLQDLVAANGLDRQGPEAWKASKGCWG